MVIYINDPFFLALITYHKGFPTHEIAAKPAQPKYIAEIALVAETQSVQERKQMIQTCGCTPQTP